jgi:acetyl esterase/lipase
MSLFALSFRITASRTDRKRDSVIPLPEGVVSHLNLSYGPHGKWNRTDIYYPEGTDHPLPTIVSIHGGGYVYGTKEIYRRYCMSLASRGFTVVNFNYRLAPEARFPAPLEDTNALLTFVCENAEKFHIDPRRMFLVGDSAGAQLTSHYAAIRSNPAFAKLFGFHVPDVKLLAIGLNCGMYDVKGMTNFPRKGIVKDYLGKKIPANDPRFDVLNAIGEGYPPAHITTACHDFLRQNAQPMLEYLQGKGIDAEMKCYGTEDNESIGHVFHVNISLPEATECNDDQTAFFKRYL